LHPHSPTKAICLALCILSVAGLHTRARTVAEHKAKMHLTSLLKSISCC
jgi:hypothetical protein